MNYFQARHAERLFSEYKALALRYWKAQPPDTRTWMASHLDGIKRAESPESLALREQVNLMFPETNCLAHELGVPVVWQSVPGPMVGGPILPVNAFLSVIDQDMGHSRVAKSEITDAVDRAIGTARLARKRALRRMVIPIYWPIDLAAFIVRIPFLILRKAGLPASVEENVISQVVKGLLTVGLLLLTLWLGLEKHIGDIIKSLGK